MDATGSVRFRVPGGSTPSPPGGWLRRGKRTVWVIETWAARTLTKFGFIAGRFAFIAGLWPGGSYTSCFHALTKPKPIGFARAFSQTEAVAKSMAAATQLLEDGYDFCLKEMRTSHQQ